MPLFVVEWLLGVGGAAFMAATFDDAGFFRNIFYNSSVPKAVVGAHGKVLIANLAMQRLLEYSEHELQNVTLAQITHPADVATDVQLFGQLLVGDRDSYFISKRWITKGGSFVWGHQEVATLRRERGKVVAVLATITEFRMETQSAQGHQPAPPASSASSKDDDPWQIKMLKGVASVKNPFKVVVAVGLLLILYWLFIDGGAALLIERLKP